MSYQLHGTLWCAETVLAKITNLVNLKRSHPHFMTLSAIARGAKITPNVLINIRRGQQKMTDDHRLALNRLIRRIEAGEVYYQGKGKPLGFRKPSEARETHRSIAINLKGIMGPLTKEP